MSAAQEQGPQPPLQLQQLLNAKSNILDLPLLLAQLKQLLAQNQLSMPEEQTAQVLSEIQEQFYIYMKQVLSGIISLSYFEIPGEEFNLYESQNAMQIYQPYRNYEQNLMVLDVVQDEHEGADSQNKVEMYKVVSTNHNIMRQRLLEYDQEKNNIFANLLKKRLVFGKSQLLQKEEVSKKSKKSDFFSEIEQIYQIKPSAAGLRLSSIQSKREERRTVKKYITITLKQVLQFIENNPLLRFTQIHQNCILNPNAINN